VRAKVRRLTAAVALLVAFATAALPAGTRAAGTPPNFSVPPVLVHVGLFYVGGPDDPVEIAFKTAPALGIEADGTSIRGGVSIQGSPTSIGHLDGLARPCYVGLAGGDARRLVVGHRYAVTITLGDGGAARKVVRVKTLVRDSSPASIRRQLGC
jgi:hypothetical protein